MPGARSAVPPCAPWPPRQLRAAAKASASGCCAPGADRSIKLGPLRAGGVELRARWRQLLQPAALDGVALGRTLALEEEAVLLLRRLPGSKRLVVWKVGLRG